MRLLEKEDFKFLFPLFLLAGFLFTFKLGATGLLDPDEPFYALTAKEMLANHEWMTPLLFGRPQFEKPALTYWILCSSFKFFGINELSARLGPAIAGISTVFLTYFWARVLFKRRQIAFISAVMLATACVFLVMARLVLTDMFLCLFVTAALCALSLGCRQPETRGWAWHLFFAFCGLGFLTKGPVGILLPFFGMIAYGLANPKEEIFKKFPWVSGFLLFAAIGTPWYACMAWRHGVNFLTHFFVHENVRRFFMAEHPTNDKPFFYALVLLAGFFPWSAFLPAAFWRASKKAVQAPSPDRNAFFFLIASFILSFIFFTFAKSKLVSYVFPLFPITALILGSWTYRLWRALRLGFKPAASLRILTGFFLGIVPAGIVFAIFFYDRQNALGLSRSIAVIAVSFVPLCWASLFFMRLKKYRAAFAGVVAAVSVCTAFAFGSFMPQADKAFSSKNAGEVAKSYLQPGGFILASKYYVRGLSFYTGDKNVGVFAEDPRRVFYTEHPIPILSSRAELLGLDPSHFPAYCVLRPKEYEAFKPLLGPPFKISFYQTNSQRILARLDRAAAA